MTQASTDLAAVLGGLGVDIHKTHGDEINGRCPVHYKTKGRDSGRYSWYLNVDSGLWHCFTCGARGNLSQLLSELTDDPASLWQVQSHLITTGLRRLSADESQYDSHVRVDVDWVRYAKFAPLPSSVLTVRNLDSAVAHRFGVRWDSDERATIVPIVSPLGELRGWQAKKTGWVRNLPEGVNKYTTLFGIERAFSSTALLVESPLDVVRFHSVCDAMDISCVSSFGANVSDAQLALLSSKFDQLIVAMDNDAAGANEARRLSKLLPSFRSGIRWWVYSPNDPKDIGEMTDGQILRGIKSASVVRV